MRTSRLVLLVASGLLLPGLAFADLVATFEVRTERTTPAGGEKSQRKAERPDKDRVTVRLGRTYVEFEDSETAELIDFQSRVITLVSRKEKTFAEIPLLSSLGFKVEEFRNRLMQAGLFEKLELKDNPAEPVLMEHLFSLRAPKSVPLKAEAKARQVSWQHKSKPLFSCETKGCKLTAEEAQAFARYLRHRYGIHPDIVTACIERAIIPQQMEIYRYDLQVEHFSVKLAKYERVDSEIDRAGLLAGATRESKELWSLCEQAGRMKGDAFDAACARLRDEGRALREAGNYFDAMLLLMEYGLCSDRLQPSEISPMAEAAQQNENFQMLFSSLMPTSEEHAKQCLQNLRALEAKTERGKRVLRIFQANILGGLGRKEEAKALFTAVLRENPVNAGAWKDLGDIFYTQYEMPLAWACWGVTRNLQPTHKNFVPVLELEKRLAEDHPEFL